MHIVVRSFPSALLAVPCIVLGIFAIAGAPQAMLAGATTKPIATIQARDWDGAWTLTERPISVAGQCSAAAQDWPAITCSWQLRVQGNVVVTLAPHAGIDLPLVGNEIQGASAAEGGAFYSLRLISTDSFLGTKTVPAMAQGSKTVYEVRGTRRTALPMAAKLLRTLGLFGPNERTE